jgi:hypothetical protein
VAQQRSVPAHETTTSKMLFIFSEGLTAKVAPQGAAIRAR